jgi:hypothetical protein
MNHDLTGIDDLLVSQKNQIEKIKFLTRIDNEQYLRFHPEVDFIIESFIMKLLEEKPANIIQYAGKLFNTTDFRKEYKDQLEIKEQREKEQKEREIREKEKKIYK